MKAVPISEKELFEIEMFGPSRLLCEFDFCSHCKQFFYKMDMKVVKAARFCNDCADILTRKTYVYYR
jgi:hypothetical protein